MRERLDSVGLIAGIGPFELGIEGMRKPNQQLFGMATKANGLLRFFFWLGIARFINNPEKLKTIINKMMADLPPVDREILAAPGLDDRFALELQQAFRQGAKWAAKEGAMYPQPWGFALKDLPSVPTFLWHGELDVNVPIQMSHKIVNEAPHIQTNFFSDEGHISLLAHHQTDILRTLMLRE